jgi:nucleotide-binding universal stress UspA family protein
MFKRILVPIDFSPPSDAALEYARSIAARYGASLQLLHVAEDTYRAFYSAEVFVPQIEGLRDEIMNETCGQREIVFVRRTSPNSTQPPSRSSERRPARSSNTLTDTTST